MRKFLLLLIVALSVGLSALAFTPTSTPTPLPTLPPTLPLTPTPTPTPTPAWTLPPTPTPTPPRESRDAYRPISSGVHVKAWFDGAWHALANEVIWAQENTPGGMLLADGMLHFMPLLEYAKSRDLPLAGSPEWFMYQITIDDFVQSVSSSLSVYRLEGDGLVLLEDEEMPAEWGGLRPGRYLFVINVSASGNGSALNSDSLLWVTR